MPCSERNRPHPALPSRCARVGRNGSALNQRETHLSRINANPGGGKTFGTDGVDEIHGSFANDYIFAGAGADTIYAGFGNDVINGGAGADHIDGGFGNDTVTYYNSASAVTVNLATGEGRNGDAHYDTYVSVENVTGSDYNDVISGNGGANVLKGGEGNDAIQGGAGGDTLDGGGGSRDMLSYQASSAGVTVNLSAGTASGGDAQDDSFTGFEWLSGSVHSDTLTGDAGENTLFGNDGIDFLFGLASNDTLSGDAGIDTLDGGTGNDTLIGGRDGDILIGGANADTFVFDTRASAQDQGIDLITDFQDGSDRLRFDIDNGTNGMSQLTIVEILGNTVISYDNGMVTLAGVSASQITAADFEFV